MKLHGYVYKHTNKLNGKIYIGQTIQTDNLERRFRHSDKTHRSYKSCPAFYNALNKYGWENFQTELVYSAFSQEALNDAEEFFINYYNTVAPSGYNSSTVTNGSIVYTDEIKKKISDKRKEYFANLEVIPEAVNKKQHVFVNNVECKICSKCKETKVLNEFNKNSGRWDGLHTYCKPCHNGLKRYEQKLSAEDFKKSYEGRQEKASVKLKELYSKDPGRKATISKQRSKPIIATKILDNSTLEFNSAKEAKQFGFDNTNIGIAIKNQIPYKGYTWKFKN